MRTKKICFVLLGILLIAAQAQKTRALSYSDIANRGQNGSSVYAYSSASLVNDNGTIYFISGATKVPFTSWAAFVGLGYSLKNVVKGDLSGYTPSQSYAITTSAAAHPWGSWLSYKNTVYYSTQGGLIGVPGAEVFTENGGQWQFVVKANKYDIAVLQANPNLPVLTAGDLRIISAPSYQFSSAPAQIPATPSPAGNQAAVSAGSAQASSTAPGILNTPTLAASSPPGQFVFGNTTNQPVAAFNFTASGSPVTIQEMDFTAVDSSGIVPVSWVSVNGSIGQFTSSSSNVSYLNIPVPTGGVTVPVTANYPIVSQNNIPDNQIFTLNLTAVKYLSGGVSSYIYPNLASNSMDLVAGAPSLTLTAPTKPITDNTVLIAKVTVTADPGDSIILNQLPLSISATGTVSVVATSSNLTVTDDSGLAVQTSYGTFGVASTSPATVNITFNSDNTISGNSSKTYDFYLPAQGTAPSLGGSSIITQLGPSGGLIYTDPAQGSNGNNIPGGASGANYILNYPTNSVSAHN